MTEAPVRVMTFVAGGRVAEVRADRSGSPGLMVVSVELDGQQSWIFEEPGWQDLAFGVSGTGVPYWWSARHLVVLPMESREEPQVISADEDIRLVFAVSEGWLLVCETSLRLVAEGQEVSRLEAGEVLLSARWEGPYLVVVDADGGDMKVRITDGRLVV